MTSVVWLMLMDSYSLALLDFPSLVHILREMAQSPDGKRRAENILPLDTPEAVKQRLVVVAEAERFADSRGAFQFHHLADPKPILERLSIPGEVLEADEFLRLLDVLKLGRDLKRALAVPEWPALAGLLSNFENFTPLIEAVERTFDPAGGIRESAHPELAEVRRNQTRFRENLQRHYQSLLSGPAARFLIPEPFITQRNNRHVLPVRLEHQRAVPGILHGTSSSGATLFIEPVSAVELNNQCLYFEDRERELILQVLTGLTRRFRERLESIKVLQSGIAELDFLFMLTRFSRRFRCTLPRLAEDGVLVLREARHPLLLETLGEERVVPISIELSAERTMLAISGPNTGGKTVALKTAGLLSLMVHCGLPVPAREAEVPFFSHILADIGDQQSIAESLSTFSAHIGRINQIASVLQALPPGSSESSGTFESSDFRNTILVLLDEPGRGTDPVHGAALAVSILDACRSRPVFVLATTHLQAVKSYASTTPGVDNASVQLDPATMRPTYRIEIGVAGASSGLEIAARLGLPAPLIEQARSLLTKQDLQAEQYLRQLREAVGRTRTLEQSLRAELEQLERRRRELESEARRREADRQKSFEKELESWSQHLQSELQRFVKGIRDRSEAARIRQQARQKEVLLKEAFRRKMKEAHPMPGLGEERQTPEALRPGDWTYHPFFKKRGKVVSIENNLATVEIDGKRVHTPLSELVPAEPREIVRRPSPQITLNVVEEFQPELVVVGQSVEEAVSRTDKFLDRAFVAQLEQVRIIHGFGSGRLKTALNEFLSGHPQVLRHQIEGGATVVTIRL